MHTIVLPDGTAIGSGPREATVLQSVSLGGSITADNEFTLGAVCPGWVKLKIFSQGEFGIEQGTELQLFRDGVRLGRFLAQKPERTGAHTFTLTAYDRTTLLDRELAPWLDSLTGWPYTLGDFALMVGQQCGLEVAVAGVNLDMAVPKLRFASVTGRKLMGWLAQLAGRFCLCDGAGVLRFATWQDTALKLTPTGENWYTGLTYEPNAVQPVTDVQAALTGLLFPEARGENSYILSGNPLITSLDDATAARLSALIPCIPSGYRPCKLTVPRQAIALGDRIAVTAPSGEVFSMLVMHITLNGERMELRCTGSPRRDSLTALHAATVTQTVSRQLQNLTGAQVLDLLTDHGAIQGIWVEDNAWYINAQVAKIVDLIAQTLISRLEDSSLTVDGASLRFASGEAETVRMENQARGLPILYMNDYEEGVRTSRGEYSPHHIRLGGTQAGGVVTLGVNPGTDAPYLILGAEGEPRTLSWKKNSDGTYTLIGT